MDRALYDKLKRTQETFTCPEGHEQHFTESTTDEYERRIDELERKLELQAEHKERYEEYWRQAQERAWQNEKRAKHLEKRLLEHVHGVVEVAPSEFKWACECGSKGSKRFDTPEEAQAHHTEHFRRKECGARDTERVVELGMQA
jgi:hypothetical protein